MSRKENTKQLQFWMDRIFEQRDRLLIVNVGRASDGIEAEGCKLEIELGGDSYDAVNFRAAGRSWMRYSQPRIRPTIDKEFIDFYGKYPDDFNALLKNLTAEVDKIVNALNVVFAAIIEKDIPEVVMDRMMGENLTSDNSAELVLHVAKKRIEELNDILQDFKCEIHELGIRTKFKERELYVNFSGQHYFVWSADNRGGNIYSVNRTFDLPTSIIIIVNYEDLKNELIRIRDTVYRFSVDLYGDKVK